MVKVEEYSEEDSQAPGVLVGGLPDPANARAAMPSSSWRKARLL